MASIHCAALGGFQPKRKAGTVEPRREIEEHHAARLQGDVRLDHAGVLVLWTVPKGPSLDTAENRLAVMTGDHPLDHGTFEGTIPQGGVPRRYTLIHAQCVSGKQNRLIHLMKAQPASGTRAEALAVAPSNLPAPVPSTLWTEQERQGCDGTVSRASGIAALVEDGCVLDGGMVVLNTAGRPDSGLLQTRMKLQGSRDIENQRRKVPVQGMLFDALQLNGQGTPRSLLHEPCTRRREALAVSPQLGVPGARAPAMTRVDRCCWLSTTPGTEVRGLGFHQPTVGGSVHPPAQDRAEDPGHPGPAGRRTAQHGADHPQLVGEVGFAKLTADGKYRHPIWHGWRDDKLPEVHWES